MMMDVGELSREFRGAKDPYAQINILADLNCCSPRKIAQTLQDAGALSGTSILPDSFPDSFAPVPPAAKRRSPGAESWRCYNKTFDEDEARRFFERGLCDEAIADQLHVAVLRITTWRRQSGLKRPRGFNQINDKRRSEGKMTKKTENAAQAPEPVREVEQETEEACEATQEPAQQQMTARGLETVLHRLLSQVLLDAPLAVNGKPLTGVTKLGVTVVNNQPYVDITLEGGAL